MHGGLCFDHTYMHPRLDPLGDVMRLVYYEHRGNGRSGRPPWEKLHFRQLCADADALREHLGFEKVSVWATLWAALSRWSTRCATLSGSSASSCSTPYPPSTTGREVEANARRKRATQEQLEALSDDEDDEEFRRAWKLLEPLYFHTYDAALADRVLTKIVFSIEANKAQAAFLEGWVPRPAWARSTRRRSSSSATTTSCALPPRRGGCTRNIPNSELVVFERSGHLPWLEEPEAFFGAVREWLRRT